MTTLSVLEHHLQAFGEGIDAIMQDFTDDSVVITPDATHRGLSEIRTFFTAIVADLPEDFWEAIVIKRQETTGELAYILWEAKPWVPLGTDTFVIRHDKIVYQTLAALSKDKH